MNCGRPLPQAQYIYTHQWQAGDLVLWDNRCTMHRRDAFDPTARPHHAPHPDQRRQAVLSRAA